MILTALNDYYHRLAGQLDSSGQAKVPPYGFSDEKIGFILVLDKLGNLVDVAPNNKRCTVPWSFDRTGKFTEKAFSEGKNPAFFLWDKAEYLVGIELIDKKKLTWEVADLPYRASKAIHLSLLQHADTAALLAVRRFFENWIPERFLESKITTGMLGANFTFKLDGELSLVSESLPARKIWVNQIENLKSQKFGYCLVTNLFQPIKNTHTKIKGVRGSQSSGASIVSFNDDAYTSYGKSQGDNAPVSEAAAFAYTTALNFLLRRENGQCILLGDTSTVFWAHAPEQKQAQLAQDLFELAMNMPTTDEGQAAQLKPVIEKIAKGQKLAEILPNVDLETRFYLLGLAPNVSRLSIRYWMDSSLGVVFSNLSCYWNDMALEPQPWNDWPSVWRLLLELTPVRRKENGVHEKRKVSDIPPQLAGEFFRSVITNTPYPLSIFTKIIDRIRSDGEINGHRVALLKAILNRNFSTLYVWSIPVALDKNHPSVAYQLGCQFALFERAQYAALGKLNSSLKDKFFGAASSAPRLAFASLHRNFSHHIADLRKGKKSDSWKGDPKLLAIWLESRTGEINNRINGGFPATLSLAEQGLFVLGYYHQRYVQKAKDQVLALAQIGEPDEIEAVLSQVRDDAE